MEMDGYTSIEKILRQIPVAIMLAVITLLFASVPAASAGHIAPCLCNVSEFAEDEVVPGEVIVGFKTTEEFAYREALISRHGGSIIDKGNTLDAVLVKVTGDTSLFIKKMQKEESVRYAESNRVVKGLMIPNDPLFQYQWGPNRVDALNKWDHETGKKSVIVAIVDTGIDYNHTDLDDNYIATGYDFVNDDNVPGDDNGHGTHCAGIVAAEINNDVGVAGIADVSIMAVKVLDHRGYGTWWGVSEGIEWAADHDANIISLSLGEPVGHPVLSDAVNHAYSKGCLLVAAAGNNYGGHVSYPAKYDEVIAISAIDGNDNLASFSNKGPEIELTAPGVCILSTWSGGGYEALRGTSTAASHVSGVAALILSQNMSLSNKELRTILQTTAHDIGAAGRDQDFGFGVVDADTDGDNFPNDWTPKYIRAVAENCTRYLPDLIVDDITWNPTEKICPGDDVVFTATVVNKGNGYVNSSFIVRFWVGDVWIGNVRVDIPPTIPPQGSVPVWIVWHADKPCDHTVRAFADWNTDVAEWDELNNGRLELFEVQGPDLIVEAISWEPDGMCPYDDVIFAATVRNVGECPVEDAFDVCFEVNGQLIDITPVTTPIAPGGFVEVYLDWYAEEPGNHTIRVDADCNDEVQEHPDGPNDMDGKFKVAAAEVNKTVWNPAISGWDISRTAKVYDKLAFNCTIYARCCNLINITVTDILSCSLNYANNVIVHYPNGTTAKMEPEVSYYAGNNTTLEWFFPGPLNKGETITITYNARNVKCHNGTNTQHVIAWCDECGKRVTGTSTVDIITEESEEHVPAITLFGLLMVLLSLSVLGAITIRKNKR